MSYLSNLNLQIGFNPYINATNNVRFRGNTPTDFGVTLPNEDNFSSSGEKYFLSKPEIESLAKSSEIIRNCAKEYNFPIKANTEELEKLRKGHMKESRILTSQILANLPSDMKSQVNSTVLQQAAMLHDYGKVLIPKEILNKEGSLKGREKEIMQLHPIFSYELLKPQGVDERVLNLIKYHHQNPSQNGYPIAGNDFEYDISSQILRAADEYSALREDRSYKQALSKEDALNIIYEDVEKGYISEEVFNALKKAV